MWEWKYPPNVKESPSTSPMHAVLKDLHTYPPKLGFINCEGRKPRLLYLCLYLLTDKSDFIIEKENYIPRKTEAGNRFLEAFLPRLCPSGRAC